MSENVRNSLSAKKMTIIYNSHDLEDRLALAELKRVSEFGFTLKTFDVAERNISRIATEKLTYQLKNKSLQEILNVAALDRLPEDQEELNDYIVANSTLLKTPLLIRRGKVEQLDTSYDYIYEEIKANYHSETVTQEDDKVNSFGESIIRKISFIFFLLALTFGLAHHLINLPIR